MTVEVKQPNRLSALVDKDGRLTLEGLELLQRAIDAIRDHETRLEALEP